MNNPNIKKIYHNPENHLIITFGSHGMKDVFEFYNSLNGEFGQNKNLLLVKDPYKNWYHRGINGKLSSIKLISNFLKKEANKHEKVYFIGGSAGGYASLLFGSIIKHKKSKIISFFPQTTLWRINGEKRNHLDKKYMNLIPFINDVSEYYLYKNDLHKKESLHDPFHVNRIMNLHRKNVICTNVPNSMMNLGDMRNNGYLSNIFKEVISND